MYESITLILSENRTSFSTDYFPSINMNIKSKSALVCLHMYNNFPNINETNNQARIYLSEVNGGSKNKMNIKIPNIFYVIEVIKKIILIYFEPNGYGENIEFDM